MSVNVFAEMQFWLLIFFSVVLPFGIYGIMLSKRAISRITVLLFGFSLVVLAGVDVYLLQALAAMAKVTPSLVDDSIFVSELAVALYLFPAMFAGIGINMISHILINHLTLAERQFEREHPDVQPGNTSKRKKARH